MRWWLQDHHPPYLLVPFLKPPPLSKTYELQVDVLEELAGKSGFTLNFKEALIGGAALDAKDDPFPDESLKACVRVVCLGQRIEGENGTVDKRKSRCTCPSHYLFRHTHSCQGGDSVLLACIGGYKWDSNPREKRPETGLLKVCMYIMHGVRLFSLPFYVRGGRSNL